MRNYGLTPQLLTRVCPQTKTDTAVKVIPALLKSLEIFGLTSRTSLMAAIGTVSIECPDFVPQIEWGDRSYFEKQYGKELGPYDDGVHPRYCGRGLIQLTWAENYKIYGDAIGVDLFKHPEKALELNNACMILAAFLHRNHIYLDAQRGDWFQVRKKVNGSGYDRLEDLKNCVSMLDKLLAK
jgi:putative chitinase